MKISEEQLYRKAVDGIFREGKPYYKPLFIFLDKFLRRHINSWCYNDYMLRGGKHGDEVLQLSIIRIVQTCEDHFFGPEKGDTKKSCDEFKAWCYKVSRRIFFTYCKREKRRIHDELDSTKKYDDNDGGDFYRNEEDLAEDRADINRCFSIVMDLSSSPHIILAWLSVSVFLLQNDMSKIESTHYVIEKFSKLTMFEMFDIVVGASHNIEWMKMTDEQISRQRKKLEKQHPETGKIIGEMVYDDFYMNKGPEMSISDWVNRVNAQIRKQWHE